MYSKKFNAVHVGNKGSKVCGQNCSKRRSLQLWHPTHSPKVQVGSRSKKEYHGKVGLTYLRNHCQACVYIWQYDIIFMIALILSPSGQMLNIELRNAEPLNSLERQLPSSSENRLHIVGHNILAIFVSYVVAPVGSVNAPAAALPPTFSSRRGMSLPSSLSPYPSTVSTLSHHKLLNTLTLPI